jgi:hypothetical protein
VGWNVSAETTKVFIAGSRQLSRLNADVKHRIDTMIEKGFTILVGDANGADKAVQRYLADKGYRNVMVHCMAGNCRNNIGAWPTREIVAPKGARGFTYYATKDQAMVDDATHGLMLWDSKSKGTLNSIINMTRQGKPVVVYVAPNRTFRNLRSASGVMDLLGKFDRGRAQRFEPTLRGRRRPGWKQELLRSLEEAADVLPKLSDDEIVKLVRTHRRKSASAKKRRLG